MKPILFTGLLAGLIHPTAVLAEMIYDYNSIRVGSNTATCRVDAALDGRDTVGSYTWTFFWKYATNTADLVPTNGSLAWTLPAFGDTYHLANCSVSSSWYPSDHSKAEEYLVAGGVPSVTHKVFGMPVGNGAAGFGSLKSGGPSSALTFRPNLDNTAFYSWGTSYNRSTYKAYDVPEILTGFYTDQLWSSCWVFYGAYNDRSNRMRPLLNCEPHIPAYQAGGDCTGEYDGSLGNGYGKYNPTDRLPDPEYCGPNFQSGGNRQGECGADCVEHSEPECNQDNYHNTQSSDCESYTPASDRGEYTGPGCDQNSHRDTQQPSDSESHTPASEAGCDCPEERGRGGNLGGHGNCEKGNSYDTERLSNSDPCAPDRQVGGDYSGECCGDVGAFADSGYDGDNSCLERSSDCEAYIPGYHAEGNCVKESDEGLGECVGRDFEGAGKGDDGEDDDGEDDDGTDENGDGEQEDENREKGENDCDGDCHGK